MLPWERGNDVKKDGQGVARKEKGNPKNQRMEPLETGSNRAEEESAWLPVGDFMRSDSYEWREKPVRVR